MAILDTTCINGIEDDLVIKTWSASRLETFESCKLRAKLAYVDRIPEPDRGDPPPKLKEWPNDRGSRVHLHAERFVMGEEPRQIAEMKAFDGEFGRLRELHQDGRVICEQGWGFTRSWESCDYKDFKNIWLRVIIDAMVFLDDQTGVVIDYKTGKRVFNEVKHAKQTQLYQLAGFLRYPQLETITTELWYLDQNELFSQDYRRSQGLKFLPGFNTRAVAMLEEEEYAPRPNTHNCRFCPYKTGMIGKHGPEGTGHCNRNPI